MRVYVHTKKFVLRATDLNFINSYLTYNLAFLVAEIIMKQLFLEELKLKNYK